jgi:predicted hydrolase (HD superfamily)
VSTDVDTAAAAVGDEVVWWTLGLLHGIDMPVDRDGTLLHDDEQVRQWLAEFRGRCSTRPAGGY